MTKGDTARKFEVSVKANKFLRVNTTKYGWYHSELRMRAWNEARHPHKLPIEAFFYLIGPEFKDAKERAIQYQVDYFKVTKIKIPVVGIRLPTPDSPILIENAEEKCLCTDEITCMLFC